MNKREFVATGVAAVVAAPALAQAADATTERAPLGALLGRTRRLPDLVERASADAFEAYVGQRFEVVGGTGVGEQWLLAGVDRVKRCAVTEQFTVSFTPAAAGAALADTDGVRILAHATGQRLALHLERSRSGADARFSLLT